MDTLALILPNSKDTTNRVIHGTKGGVDHANQLGGLIEQIPICVPLDSGDPGPSTGYRVGTCSLLMWRRPSPQ